jgi:DNA-binding SARP family transcriptional activator
VRSKAPELRPGLAVSAARRLRALLGLLAIRAPHPVGRDEIVDLLWGKQPPRTRQALMNTYIARLRDLLEPNRPRAAAGAASPERAGALDVDWHSFARAGRSYEEAADVGTKMPAREKYEQELENGRLGT